jgi:hypothetical protein
MATLAVRTHSDRLEIGGLEITFQRTLRIPDDGHIYPLSPGLGQFPMRKVEHYADRVPDAWRDRGGVFIPMYQREALWMSFHSPELMAVKVGIGKIDALTGKRWSERLTKRPRNYLVCPDQPWLDGINAGDGFIRQFVAMPLGMGYAVEGRSPAKRERAASRSRRSRASSRRGPSRAPSSTASTRWPCPRHRWGWGPGER